MNNSIFILLMVTISFAQIPSKFTLISTHTEDRFIHHNSSRDDVTLPQFTTEANFKAACSIVNGYCKLVRTVSSGVLKDMVYAEGTETFTLKFDSFVIIDNDGQVKDSSGINPPYNKLFIIERENCGKHYQYLLNFIDNTFIGGSFQCNNFLGHCAITTEIVKGIIIPAKNCSKIKVTQFTQCHEAVK